MSLAAPSTTSSNGIDTAAEARDSLVAALETVPGLVVSRSAPVTPAPMCAWPKWAITNYQGGRLLSVGGHEFDVLVLLPNSGDSTTTEQSADALLGAVVTALWPVAVVVSAQPANVVFENQSTMPALQVRVVPHVC